jgi:hypothetical protein
MKPNEQNEIIKPLVHIRSLKKSVKTAPPRKRPDQHKTRMAVGDSR